MSEPFDPYRKWLGIPPKEQPAHHYRLLGIATFEDDPDVIENAAARQMAHVRTFQTSKQHGPVSQRILTELSAAKVCLLDRERKTEYDVQLRSRLAAEGKLSSADLTQAVSEGGVDDVAEPDLSPLRRSGDRWRSGAAFEAASVSLPVPIPMSGGATGAGGSPTFPAIRRSTTSLARSHRKSSAVPIAITVISLLALVGLGIVAFVLSNGLAGPTAGKPKSKPTTTRTQKPTDQPATPVLKPQPDSAVAPAPTATRVKPPRADDVGDRIRQTLYQAETALAERHGEKFQEQILRAEQLVADNPSAAAEFKTRVEDLQAIKKLVDEFWSSVRENLQSKLEVGKTIEFRKHKFELLAREGDTIEYSLDDLKNKTPLMAMEPRAAVVVAVRLDAPDTFLPAAAFLAVDGQVQDKEEARKLGKQLFAKARESGKVDPAVARHLGLRSAEDEIKLDDDLAPPTPTPSPEPEKKGEPPASEKPAENSPEKLASEPGSE